MTSDEIWEKDRKKYGWELPHPAPEWLRLPLIKTMRCAKYAFLVGRHNERFRRLGLIPTGYDEWVVYAIGRGWCDE